MDNRYVNYQTPENFYGQGGYVPQQQPNGFQQQNPQYYYGYNQSQTQQLPGFQAHMAAQNPPPPYPPPQRSPQQYTRPPSHPMVVIPQPSPPPRINPSPPTNYAPTPQTHHHASWQYPQPQSSPQLQYQQFRNHSPQLQYQQPPRTQYPAPSPPIPQQFLRSQPVVEIPMVWPQQNRQHVQPPKPQPVPPPSPPRAVPAAPRPRPPPAPQQQPVDYQMVLLSLAEEYINAAHSMGSTVALLKRAADLEQYYKLIATGLGCLEVVLKRFRLAPRVEASVTVRYVSLLYEETENYAEMESLLMKGISLCDRNRMFDLKYTLHHLQARILFKSSPKAALKALDAVIANAEAYQHTPWIYALRLLRVSLSIKLSDSHHEMHNAAQHLQAITEWAETQGDNEMRVTSATLEAMVHILSSTSDRVEQANHAIATARSLQLKPNITNRIPQIWALLDFVDLACSLLQSNPEEAKAKMAVMARLLDELWEKVNWADDGALFVPLGQNHDRKLTESTNGIFERDQAGDDKIILQWLSKHDLYAVGYAISATASLLRATNDSKAYEYVVSGLKWMKDDFKPSSIDKPAINPASSSLSSATARTNWRQRMEWYFRMQLSFVYCCQLKWDSSSKIVEHLKSGLAKLDTTNPEDFKRWIKYLEATIAQGTGDLDKALAIYQSPIFMLPDLPANRLPTAQHDLAILASLNQLLILLPQQSFLVDTILAALEPIALDHHHKSIISATWFVKTLVDNEETKTIMGRKQVLQHSLQAARKMGNQQLLARCMALMNIFFFRNIVGEQAHKSMRTGFVLAQRNEGEAHDEGGYTGGGLWTAVAGNMYADLLERQGALKDAEKLRDETEAVVEALPEKVKRRFVEE